MAKETFLDSHLWQEFQRAARRRRRNPVTLVTQYMRECLEIWEDQKLDDEIVRDVRQSGYHELDAVKLVRQHRLGKKTERAAS